MIPIRERWWSDFGAFDGVEVFIVDASDNPGRETASLAILNSEEVTRYGSFVLPEPKRRFALCRAALRSILCESLKCENVALDFAETDKGKPFALLSGERVGLNFNVSHSGDHGLIAIGNVSILGVDVETRRQRRDLQFLVESVMSPAEQQHFEAYADSDGKHDLFFDFWTVKEAVLKAVGVGMSGPEPNQIEVPRAMREGSRSCVAGFPQLFDGCFRILNLGTTEFAAALAFKVD